MQAYLTIIPKQHYEIIGPVSLPGREGSIEVLGIEHALIAQFDPSTGTPIGPHRHEPLVILKKVDCTSPYLRSLYAQGLPSKCQLSFWGYSSHDEREGSGCLYTMELKNAWITGIWMQSAISPHNPNYDDFVERISLAYRTISWKDEESAVDSTLDWNQ